MPIEAYYRRAGPMLLGCRAHDNHTRGATAPPCRCSMSYNRVLLPLAIDERTNEAPFLERKRDPRGREERLVRALRKEVQAGHPLLAGDESRARSNRDRSAGLLRVLELGHEEGLR